MEMLAIIATLFGAGAGMTAFTGMTPVDWAQFARYGWLRMTGQDPAAKKMMGDLSSNVKDFIKGDLGQTVIGFLSFVATNVFGMMSKAEANWGAGLDNLNANNSTAALAAKINGHAGGDHLVGRAEHILKDPMQFLQNHATSSWSTPAAQAAYKAWKTGDKGAARDIIMKTFKPGEPLHNKVIEDARKEMLGKLDFTLKKEALIAKDLVAENASDETVNEVLTAMQNHAAGQALNDYVTAAKAHIFKTFETNISHEGTELVASQNASLQSAANKLPNSFAAFKTAVLEKREGLKAEIRDMGIVGTHLLKPDVLKKNTQALIENMHAGSNHEKHFTPEERSALATYLSNPANSTVAQRIQKALASDGLKNSEILDFDMTKDTNGTLTSITIDHRSGGLTSKSQNFIQ